MKQIKQYFYRQLVNIHDENLFKKQNKIKIPFSILV